jgi:hypothetical protein
LYPHFVLPHYFVGKKELAHRLLNSEQVRSESLLNVWPEEIVQPANGDQTIADHHPGQYPICRPGQAPSVGQLTLEMLSCSTNLLPLMPDEKYAVEKIRTIGDSYDRFRSSTPWDGLPRHWALTSICALRWIPTVQGHRPHLIDQFGPGDCRGIGEKLSRAGRYGHTASPESHGQPGGFRSRFQLSADLMSSNASRTGCGYQG